MIAFEEKPQPTPGTHVLVIGVGHYPHLIKGEKKLANKPLALKSLTSPPISAKAVADWFLSPLNKPGSSGFRNPQCPLASLDLVVAGTGKLTVVAPGGPVDIPPDAEFATIRKAFKAWRDRVNTHPDNVGVFYFCGHGVSTGDSHIVLAQDFGSDDDAPWSGAIDMTETMFVADRQTVANTYFFLDACQEIVKDFVLSKGDKPRALSTSDLSDSVTMKSRILVNATGTGQRAFAEKGEVSRFTAALLAALSGYAGVKTAGKATWDVDGEVLAQAIRRLLEAGNKRPGAERQMSAQRIEGDISPPLVRAPTAPQVKVTIDVAPDIHLPVSLITVRSERYGEIQHDGSTGAFSADLPRGIYTIAAKAKASQFKAFLLENEEFQPPCYNWSIPVEP